jgi:Flp pilus assembly protein TadG
MHPFSTNTFKRPALRQRGASAVEMALLLPLLVLMLDGVLEFGLILHNQSVLTSAASLAARAGIVQNTPKLDTTQIAAIAKNYCADSLISLGTTQVSAVTVVQAADPVYPYPLQVTVHFTFNGLLAVLRTNPVLSATTVMYNE